MLEKFEFWVVSVINCAAVLDWRETLEGGNRDFDLKKREWENFCFQIQKKKDISFPKNNKDNGLC